MHPQRIIARRRCPICSTEFTVTTRKPNQRFCSHACVGRSQRRPHAIRTRLTTAQRFWGKVNKDSPVPAHAPWLGQCWLWTASRASYGRYGQFGLDGRAGGTIGAHRFSWQSEHGPIPDGLHVCHHCDTTLCVRPSHLFLGTQLANIHDAIDKGRMPPSAFGNYFGSCNHNAKIDADAVRSIRALHQRGVDGSAIARMFGVSKSAISSVLLGKTWKHVS